MNVMNDDGIVVEVDDPVVPQSSLPPTGYDLDQDLFEIYMESLRLKCIEEDVDMQDIPAVFEVMRRWWYIMTDVDAVKAYIAGSKKAQLEAEKADHEQAIQSIDEELQNE